MLQHSKCCASSSCMLHIQCNACFSRNLKDAEYLNFSQIYTEKSLGLKYSRHIRNVNKSILPYSPTRVFLNITQTFLYKKVFLTGTHKSRKAKMRNSFYMNNAILTAVKILWYAYSMLPRHSQLICTFLITGMYSVS